ncbi:zinc ABC transporter substrate-binding protein [uncultured Marivita sp.]|uniref:zinc ABC transporter substrate-binding protein n=1 Tax=uncultured Marivita sp. TaxID=888080 RepID=UPI0026132E24|nr:zinc ABC transporter substrate-binding protein [uncultured Marivita sp.]
MLRSICLVASTAVFTQSAWADVPKVVTDIAPIHGLASMVMGDLGAPSMMIEPGTSPHSNAMRPSVAAALQDADVVFWVGEELSPWLHDPIETLGETAQHVALLDLDASRRLASRDIESFSSQEDDHGHDDHGHDDHDHDNHGHDDHAEEGHDHDHSGTDPHAWLDPQNAQTWVTHIAEVLAERAPENADTYKANAASAVQQIETAVENAQERLSAFQDRPFIVFHDAYQYFETRFGLKASGALSLSDAVPPSPSHVAEIQTRIRETGIVCVFSEPQYSDGLVQTVIDGTEARSVELDPLGVALEPGASFYPDLINDMATRFETCLQ